MNLLFRVSYPCRDGDAPDLVQRVIDHVKRKGDHVVAEGVDGNIARTEARCDHGLGPRDLFVIRLTGFMNGPGET